MYHGSLLNRGDQASAPPRPVNTPGSADTLDSGRSLVMIVDDDAAMREALIALMESVGLDAIAFASARALAEAERSDRPGCLVVDVRMPGASGLDLQRQLAAEGDARPIVFLTGHGDIPMTVQAMKAGAVDFLTKPVRDQTLLDAVTRGIERDIAQREDASIDRRHRDNYARLTTREREVMRSVALGRLNKQIAYELGISVVTVKLHRSSVMRKMEATTIGDLIRAWERLARASGGQPLS